MEATGYAGEGIILVADTDDPELTWARRVLANIQEFVLASGFVVQRLMPQLHEYHLDDTPDLRSCNLMIKALLDNEPPGRSEAITDAKRLSNFYGRETYPRARYVRERVRLDYGKAHEDEYDLELLEEDGTH